MRAGTAINNGFIIVYLQSYTLSKVISPERTVFIWLFCLKEHIHLLDLVGQKVNWKLPYSYVSLGHSAALIVVYPSSTQRSLSTTFGVVDFGLRV
jgi:hypothetical protein